MNTELRAFDRTSADGTVGKAMDVLDLVASFERPVRFAELQTRSAQPKATLYRLVQTLTNTGMLSHDVVTQTYSPGLRLVRLAHAAWSRASLAPIARDHLDRLATDTGETVHLAQMDAGQVIYVDKRNAATPVDMFSQAGKVGPGYCTGVGKAIMAWLDGPQLDAALQRQSYFAHTSNTLTDAAALRAELADIRETGFAYDREEHEIGIICIAAPILSPRGRVHGALSITTTTARNSLHDLDAFRPRLQQTTHDIAAAVADWQFPT